MSVFCLCPSVSCHVGCVRQKHDPARTANSRVEFPPLLGLRTTWKKKLKYMFPISKIEKQLYLIWCESSSHWYLQSVCPSSLPVSAAYKVGVFTNNMNMIKNLVANNSGDQ